MPMSSREDYRQSRKGGHASLAGRIKKALVADRQAVLEEIARRGTSSRQRVQSGKTFADDDVAVSTDDDIGDD